MAFDDDLLAELDELGDDMADESMGVVDASTQQPHSTITAIEPASADISALGEASNADRVDEEHEAFIGKVVSSAGSVYEVAKCSQSHEL
ncbi:hypothetical protein IWW46_001832, partial [Coemansia sp. RSA 2440]